MKWWLWGSYLPAGACPHPPHQGRIIIMLCHAHGACAGQGVAHAPAVGAWGLGEFNSLLVAGWRLPWAVVGQGDGSVPVLHLGGRSDMVGEALQLHMAAQWQVLLPEGLL